MERTSAAETADGRKTSASERISADLRTVPGGKKGAGDCAGGLPLRPGEGREGTKRASGVGTGLSGRAGRDPGSRIDRRETLSGVRCPAPSESGEKAGRNP